eukprot:gene17792-biopygen8103
MQRLWAVRGGEMFHGGFPEYRRRLPRPADGATFPKQGSSYFGSERTPVAEARTGGGAGGFGGGLFGPRSALYQHLPPILRYCDTGRYCDAGHRPILRYCDTGRYCGTGHRPILRCQSAGDTVILARGRYCDTSQRAMPCYCNNPILRFRDTGHRPIVRCWPEADPAIATRQRSAGMHVTKTCNSPHPRTEAASRDDTGALGHPWAPSQSAVSRGRYSIDNAIPILRYCDTADEPILVY